MKDSNKIKSLIGFSVKAGKAVLGIDNPLVQKKRLHLALVCATASDNTKGKVKRLAQSKGIPLIQTDLPLDEILKRNCKVIMITDAQMAQAIIRYTNEGEAGSDI